MKIEFELKSNHVTALILVSNIQVFRELKIYHHGVQQVSIRFLLAPPMHTRTDVKKLTN